LLDSISYPELLEWGDYYHDEPWGEFRADVRAAQICGLIANTNRGKDQKPFTLQEFMLFEKQDAQPTPAIVDVSSDATPAPAEPGTAVITPQMTQWLFAASRSKGKAKPTHGN
jgi:hypothetical protein